MKQPDFRTPISRNVLRLGKVHSHDIWVIAADLLLSQFSARLKLDWLT